MDVFPKFIIEEDELEGDCLIISKCTYHKQLVTFPDKVKGGGWWSLNEQLKEFTLFGDSYDFGSANIEDIKKCVELGKVFTNKSLIKTLQGYTFKYKDSSGEIINL